METTAPASSRRSGALLALVVAAAALLVLALGACRPQTLEDYVGSHQDEWNEDMVQPIEQVVDESEGVFTDSNVTLKDNDITVTFVCAYDASTFDGYDYIWDSMYSEMESDMESAIDQFDDAGISGVTITLNIDGSDGEPIATHTFK